jgi:hypothetical protein
MRYHLLPAAALSLWLIGATGAAESQGIDALARQSLAAAMKSAAFRKEAAAVTADVNPQIAQLNNYLFALRVQKPLTADQVGEKQREIANLTAHLETLKKVLELGQIADADLRDKKVAEYEAQLKELQDRAQEVSKPVFEKLQAHIQAGRPLEKAMLDALKDFFKPPPAPFADVQLPTITGQFSEGSYTATWKDKDGQQVAWITLQLLPKPSDNGAAPKFDGKFSILDSTNSTLLLWVGHFHTTFMMTKAQWQKTEMVEAAVRSLIDLDKLAAVDAGP